jgi:hypothetical protein
MQSSIAISRSDGLESRDDKKSCSRDIVHTAKKLGRLVLRTDTDTDTKLSYSLNHGSLTASRHPMRRGLPNADGDATKMTLRINT